MGGNVSGSAAPSGTSTGTQSSMPTGGKGSNGPIQPYQGGQQAIQGQPYQSNSSPLGLFGAGPATDPSPFMQQQNQQQQNYGGAFGLGQTAQSAQQQQYNPNPQQMGIQGLLGGYGKGGGGAMPNPYQPQQSGMPMQQLGQSFNPVSDQGMVAPQQFIQQAQQQALQQNPQQQPQTQTQAQAVQQPSTGSNMFYNMSAADIDKYNALRG
jgi:hypothetical protein